MALTKLDPNVIGQDSTGTGKITSAGGSVSIDSSGNVRIANASANSVLFAANGYIGVNATAPNYPVDVGGVIRAQAQSGATNNTAPTALVVSNKTSGGNSSSQGASLQFEYNNSTGGYSGGLISSVSGSDPFTADLRFFPRNYGFTEALRIAANGNIGIGTTTPDQLLKIHGATAPAIVITETGNTVSTLLYSDTSRGYVGTQTAHNFNIKTSDSIRMTVAANGNIGINNTSPSVSLYVGSTDAIKFPSGNTAQRPTSPVNGMVRYNTDRSTLEYYNNGWTDVSVDLSPFGDITSTSMAHSGVNTTEAGSTPISSLGFAAISQDSYTNGNFGCHDGHEGSPADWPGYAAIYIGGTYPTGKAVNKLTVTLHGNSFGFFELQGSNDASTSGTFYNTGNWTSLPFTSSGSSLSVQNGGGQGSGYSDGTVLTFRYTNNSPYTHYRIWFKDASQPGEALGTRYVGWATYYWTLERV